MLKSFKQKKKKGKGKNGLRFRKVIPAAARGGGTGAGELRGRGTMRGPSLTGEKRWGRGRSNSPKSCFRSTICSTQFGPGRQKNGGIQSDHKLGTWGTGSKVVVINLKRDPGKTMWLRVGQIVNRNLDLPGETPDRPLEPR